MRFYDALQLDPSILKRKIASCETKKEKYFYYTAMALRAALIVAFAIVFISILTFFFGSENTPMAVVIFCIMLGIRFVNFECCAGDSLAMLAIALTILLAVPYALTVISPVLLIPLHFLAVFVLMYITTQRPELGNGGIYSFAYVYLTGNPVSGEILVQRGFMALTGFVICGAILYAKHKEKHSEIRFHHIIRSFDITDHVHLWHIRMAAGVSLILSLGQIFAVERFMWMGFACASLLSEYPYPGNAPLRFRQRIAGVIAGSCSFFLLWILTPDSLHFVLGPLGGFLMGFCTDYKYKTAMNCFGALMIGAGIYGIQDAVMLRIINTVLGITFGLVFALVFHRLVAAKLLPDTSSRISDVSAAE